MSHARFISICARTVSYACRSRSLHTHAHAGRPNNNNSMQLLQMESNVTCATSHPLLQHLKKHLQHMSENS
jgi:hypothetical protein